MIGTPGWCNAGSSSCDTLNEFVSWLNSQPAGLAIMNHPGQYGSSAWNNFVFPQSPRIIGLELWNRNNDYFLRTGQSGKRYFDEALQKGWRIGAGGGQDNHDRSWGTMNGARMAVLATELSRNGIMEALASRRFYTTLINGVRVSFKCDGKEMGSVISGSGGHSCTVRVLSGHTFTWIEVVKNGSNAASVANPSFPFTLNISTTGNEYVYVVLWQGNDWKVVSSPIFFQ